MLGDRETHRLVREPSVRANAVVVFVNHDRSPENRFPVAVEEGYAVLKHVAEHPDDFGVDDRWPRAPSANKPAAPDWPFTDRKRSKVRIA